MQVTDIIVQDDRHIVQDYRHIVLYDQYKFSSSAREVCERVHKGYSKQGFKSFSPIFVLHSWEVLGRSTSSKGPGSLLASGGSKRSQFSARFKRKQKESILCPPQEEAKGVGSLLHRGW
ncbi:hypothetical protein MA16_Dca019193 [Dendrobium catenatum]|uniref:Uncharacterized protein n=1 Tax=Dendrobium catenatum TaxID=906689 RepID=A0A2I0VS79_9ASPA|nr:hypothetical protein MA16_Dca019193 [Dendrobium catenatum]